MKKIIKSIFAFFNIAVRSKSKLDKKLSMQDDWYTFS